MEVLKLKTPLYLMWGRTKMFKEDGSVGGYEYYPGSWTPHDNDDECIQWMERINRFFLSNIEDLRPKSLGQRFWIAEIQFDSCLSAYQVKTKTEINVGVVCPQMLEPYGILSPEYIINKVVYVNGKPYRHIHHPFFIPGYSSFRELNYTILSLLGFNKKDIKNLSDTYLWYHMKKKALGL